jgi:hypothetical protein
MRLLELTFEEGVIVQEVYREIMGYLRIEIHAAKNPDNKMRLQRKWKLVKRISSDLAEQAL